MNCSSAAAYVAHGIVMKERVQKKQCNIATGMVRHAVPCSGNTRRGHPVTSAPEADVRE